MRKENLSFGQLQAKVDALTVVVEYLMARASAGTSDPLQVHGMHLQQLLAAYHDTDDRTRQAIQDIFDDGRQWMGGRAD